MNSWLNLLLPAFLRWSSIITDEIMNTFPMLPMTDKQASTSKRAILGHSVDNVTGEKSLMCGRVLLTNPWMCRWDENNVVVNLVVAAVVVTTAGAIAVSVPLTVTLLLNNNVATVDVAFILLGIFFFFFSFDVNIQFIHDSCRNLWARLPYWCKMRRDYLNEKREMHRNSFDE